VKKLRKSVNICQSYQKNKSVLFFYGPQCISVQVELVSHSDHITFRIHLHYAVLTRAYASFSKIP